VNPNLATLFSPTLYQRLLFLALKKGVTTRPGEILDILGSLTGNEGTLLAQTMGKLVIFQIQKEKPRASPVIFLVFMGLSF